MMRLGRLQVASHVAYFALCTASCAKNERKYWVDRELGYRSSVDELASIQHCNSASFISIIHEPCCCCCCMVARCANTAQVHDSGRCLDYCNAVLLLRCRWTQTATTVPPRWLRHYRSVSSCSPCLFVRNYATNDRNDRINCSENDESQSTRRWSINRTMVQCTMVQCCVLKSRFVLSYCAVVHHVFEACALDLLLLLLLYY